MNAYLAPLDCQVHSHSANDLAVTTLPPRVLLERTLERAHTALLSFQPPHHLLSLQLFSAIFLRFLLIGSFTADINKTRARAKKPFRYENATLSSYKARNFVTFGC